ncbi:hypothetical protein PMAYCL1PPCAC_20318, partial [Pristionchus mayeri]
DTETMTFMPALKIGEQISEIWYCSDSNADREITLGVTIGETHYSFNTQLPDGYYGDAVTRHDHIASSVHRRENIAENIKSMQLSHQEDFSSRLVNEFNVKRILGTGAFGIVFEVVHPVVDWKFAVKRISVKRE